MEKFRLWWFANQSRILWFFIGWNTLSGINSLGRGDYIGVAISAALIWIMVVVALDK